MENKVFNQQEYINQYKKEHYSKLVVDLKKETKQELDRLCKEKGITLKQFVLDAIEQLKK
mgnify:CR=1 FL=1